VEVHGLVGLAPLYLDRLLARLPCRGGGDPSSAAGDGILFVLYLMGQFDFPSFPSMLRAALYANRVERFLGGRHGVNLASSCASCRRCAFLETRDCSKSIGLKQSTFRILYGNPYLNHSNRTLIIQRTGGQSRRLPAILQISGINE